MFWFLHIAAFVAAFSLTLAVYYLGASRARVRERLTAIAQVGGGMGEDHMALPFFERVLKPASARLGQGIERLTPKKIKDDMDRTLEHAGRPWNLGANGLMVLQFSTFLIFFSLGWGISRLTGALGGGFLLALLLGLLGLIIPLMAVNIKARNRKIELQKTLPDFLDMLYVSVEAGLGFDMALKRVAEQMPGEMADEFKRTLEEIKAGRARTEALRNIIKRTGVQDLSTFVSSVIQTEQMGSNIGNTLRVQADAMRTKRRQRAEENAMKAPVKMLFPIIFFIFPALFVVILGPAVIRIIEVFVDMF